MFRGKKCCLQDVTFGVEKNEKFGLVGVGGSGRTTAFEIVAGHLRPSTGTAVLSGCDTYNLKASSLQPCLVAEQKLSRSEGNSAKLVESGNSNANCKIGSVSEVRLLHQEGCPAWSSDLPSEHYDHRRLDW